MPEVEDISEDIEEYSELPLSFLGWLGLLSFSLGFILSSILLLLLR